MASHASGPARLQNAALADEIEFLAARVRALGSALANRHLDPVKLRVRSYSVLALATPEVAPTQRELADFLRLDPSQIVSLIDELESAGLVTRQADPSDRRSRIIVQTPAGAARHRAGQRATRAAEDEALAHLSPAERAQLRALLAKAAFPGSG